MVKVNAEEFAKKWGDNLKGSTERMKVQVDKVTEAPSVKAAAKQDKMIANLTAKINDGTWAANLKKYSLEDWKKDMKDTGIPRISGGVDKAKEKVTSFAGKLLSYEDTLQGEVRRMADLTLEDSIARASKWIRKMSEFKK